MLFSLGVAPFYISSNSRAHFSPHLHQDLLFSGFVSDNSKPNTHQAFSNESTLRMRWPKYWSFSLGVKNHSPAPTGNHSVR